MELIELLKSVDNYYPKGITLNDPEFQNQIAFVNLSNACLAANNNQAQWRALLNELKTKF